MKKTFIATFLAGMGLMGCNPSSTAIMVNEDRPIDNALTEKEMEEGWELLFDGQSADGWRGYNLDFLPDSWVIDQGTLKSLGKGGDIGGDIVYGTKSYGDFELVLDWKIEEG